jgi:multiple sugar transport system substrate-binding protein
MKLDGPWALSTLDKVDGLDYGVVQPPTGPNGDQGAYMGGFGLVIPEGAKNAEGAWEFMKWWNTPENQVGWYLNAGGNAPSRKSLYARSPIGDSPIWKPLLPFITESAGSPRPMSDRYTEFAESMTPPIMAGYNGQTSPREALDEAARIGNAFWQGIGGGASKAL